MLCIDISWGFVQVKIDFLLNFSGENVYIRANVLVATRPRRSRKLMQAPRKRCVDFLFAYLETYDL